MILLKSFAGILSPMKSMQTEISSQFQFIFSPLWKEYELVDSGDGAKLERLDTFHIIRPEAEAVWPRALPQKEWAKAVAIFKPSNTEQEGRWEGIFPGNNTSTVLHYKDLSFSVQFSSSRHIGIFPEQAAQWDWIAEKISNVNRPISILNLFGYTGLATLSAAKAGARVTHVDASKKAIAWARGNQQASGLTDKPIRWIVDDAVKYLKREVNRSVRYDGIILDPPKFGRGPKGEVWEFYKLLPDLLDLCRQVISKQPLFVILTAYAVKASSLTLCNALQNTMSGLAGSISFGELVLKESSAGRNLSTAVFAQWSA
jgi:23S rRNA (cytosine1962-C5)-methyltransferase